MHLYGKSVSCGRMAGKEDILHPVLLPGGGSMGTAEMGSVRTSTDDMGV